ncbi:MAG: ATP-dependent Clp protease adaptor ClpS [Deltaproteobacteria bacterium]|nr:ATP-dependent Clp protease adaptor ClpS [Deltaproteobacteria bacterium]MBW2211127.1 ATP-dependent Clp protease adaptor ClpS [Deltaproteobacteria bacterium]MBW2214459.1 ATP-dependent Clp protease adaptor ClpS [Deltaproteobacteria bacterium]MBW2380002.1 ATP-dependent Clp protease adaptor ClpS [Deltaproteobacteria bacterium]MBW2550497.1 ATP-dependent Clp protease adaptor ClpS [Deltaproteobacteria bacterium]
MAERFENDAGTTTEVKPEKKLKRPRLYRVLLHNDDYTTREFVVQVLHTVFHRGEQDAIRIMLHVHHNGVGVAGVFTREVAETKVQRVEHLAREHEFPLRLTMEPEEEEDA